MLTGSIPKMAEHTSRNGALLLKGEEMRKKLIPLLEVQRETEPVLDLNANIKCATELNGIKQSLTPPKENQIKSSENA